VIMSNLFLPKSRQNNNFQEVDFTRQARGEDNFRDDDFDSGDFDNEEAVFDNFQNNFEDDDFSKNSYNQNPKKINRTSKNPHHFSGQRSHQDYVQNQGNNSQNYPENSQEDSQANQRSSFLPFVFLFLISLLLLASLVFAYYVFGRNDVKVDVKNNVGKINQIAQTPNLNNIDFGEITKQKPKELTLKMLFLGNTFWGRYIDDWAKASPLKEKYPFSGLSTLEKEKYDAWISGLECPITSTFRSSQEQDTDLKFSCLPEYTPEASRWIDAFTLANNHTDNMEEVDGFEQTKKNLAGNGIQYFGHYDSDQEDELCKIITFPVKKKDFTKNSNSNSSSNNSTKSTNNSQNYELNPQTNQPYFLPLALCGYHNVFKLPTDAQLAKITEHSKFLPTIVMPHGGAEYTSKADQIKTSLYRQMIDLGADAVIGDHPHAVQNSEVWQKKLIIYSLGNFIFDQQGSQGVRQSLVMDLEMTVDFDENLEKWLEIAQTCRENDNKKLGTIKIKENKSDNSDGNSAQNSVKSIASLSKIQSETGKNCLDLAKNQKLKKPNFTFKWDALATDSTGKLTKKASSEITQNVLNIANWATTKQELEK
jgi:hypothetical protein